VPRLMAEAWRLILVNRAAENINCAKRMGVLLIMAVVVPGSIHHRDQIP